MSKPMIKIGIVGGTGYTGVELLRLLSAHPHAEVQAITSRGEAGIALANYFPSLLGSPLSHLQFTDPTTTDLTLCDVVFFATPHGIAMRDAPALLAAGTKIIDLAADFRIQDTAIFQQWYGLEHSCPDLLKQAVYGLPEIHRQQIRTAQVVGNPGCYPTLVQLGFFPLLQAQAIDPLSLIADCKSGVSGAGRKAETGLLLSECSDNFKAYGVTGHRHTPEILQGLRAISPSADIIFTPHLVPMIRGMFGTLYARLTDEQCDVHALFEQQYANEPFVEVLPKGMFPETRWARGANKIYFAVHQQGHQVRILAAQDNLVKGAAGQAIQNMNILFDLPETTGLSQVALIP